MCMCQECNTTFQRFSLKESVGAKKRSWRGTGLTGQLECQRRNTGRLRDTVVLDRWCFLSGSLCGWVNLQALFEPQPWQSKFPTGRHGPSPFVHCTTNWARPLSWFKATRALYPAHSSHWGCIFLMNLPTLFYVLLLLLGQWIVWSGNVVVCGCLWSLVTVWETTWWFCRLLWNATLSITGR